MGEPELPRLTGKEIGQRQLDEAEALLRVALNAPPSTARSNWRLKWDRAQGSAGWTVEYKGRRIDMPGL